MLARRPPSEKTQQTGYIFIAANRDTSRADWERQKTKTLFVKKKSENIIFELC